MRLLAAPAPSPAPDPQQKFVENYLKSLNCLRNECKYFHLTKPPTNAHSAKDEDD
jgi:hypothetical protein